LRAPLYPESTPLSPIDELGESFTGPMDAPRSAVASIIDGGGGGIRVARISGIWLLPTL
jgi:hypothetical protein